MWPPARSSAGPFPGERGLWLVRGALLCKIKKIVVMPLKRNCIATRKKKGSKQIFPFASRHVLSFKDSNPDKQIQNLMCYHYTKGHRSIAVQI